MLELYAFATPNSVKPVIALEEMGLDDALHAVNVRKGEQKVPQFLALNPNGNVPVLVDPEAEGGRLVLSVPRDARVKPGHDEVTVFFG